MVKAIYTAILKASGSLEEQRPIQNHIHAYKGTYFTCKFPCRYSFIIPTFCKCREVDQRMTSDEYQQGISRYLAISYCMSLQAAHATRPNITRKSNISKHVACRKRFIGNTYPVAHHFSGKIQVFDVYARHHLRRKGHFRNIKGKRKKCRHYTSDHISGARCSVVRT